jgi:CRISPR system Cascade subunit CasB
MSRYSGKDVDRAVHAMAALFRDGGALSNGERAELRRMDPRRIDAPAFWKLAARFFDDALAPGAALREQQETAWASVVVGLAFLEQGAVGPRAGHALRDAKLSEARFVRFLRADNDALIDELPALARFVAAKGVAIDWADVARVLLLSDDAAEQQRRALARDYYTNPDAKKDAA